MINLTTQLPNKPSQLIRLAIQDLNAAKDDDSTTIDMHNWLLFGGVLFSDQETCSTCLAGAVMKYSLGIDSGFLGMIERDADEVHTDEIIPNDFNSSIRDKLRAINEFRVGNLVGGCNHLGVKTTLGNRSPIRYERVGHEEFCRRMLLLATEFENEGN